MWLRFSLILICIVYTLNDSAFGQTIPEPADSNKLYENIETLSEHNKFTKLIYSLVFKPASPVIIQKKGKKKTYYGHVQKPYSAFEGKIIRNIIVETLDPFGYSMTDSIVKKQNLLTKSENSLHIKTREITIRNLLLIRKNQVFDSLLVKESERLVRSREYVVDVSFRVTSPSKNSDSVDIYIRSLDRWSIIPGFGFSGSNVSLELSDNNFMGLGHEFKTGGSWFTNPEAFAYLTNYYVPNIRNTYVNTRLSYAKDKFGNYNKYVAIDRPFFSPFAKWAAGAIMANEFRRDSLLSLDSVYIQQKFNYKTQDFWAGSAVQIFKGLTEQNRTTNFISAARFLRIRYLERPEGNFDVQNKYSDEDFYMTSIGISTRKYVKDKYVFKFGLTEDVPIGKVFSLTAGYQKKNYLGRHYFGARVSTGNYYPWGYMSSNLEYGTFFNNGQSEQGAISAGINYYTSLFEVGKWKFRQFLKPQVVIGINRFSNDSINLNEGYGLDGFKSTELWGSSRIVFTMQTQSYAPWSLIGFSFGPYVNRSIGMLGNNVTRF